MILSLFLIIKKILCFMSRQDILFWFWPPPKGHLRFGKAIRSNLGMYIHTLSGV